MSQSVAGQIADAEAEAYWSKRERQAEARRNRKNRPICYMCKTRPVEAKEGALLCKTDADEYRRICGHDLY